MRSKKQARRPSTDAPAAPRAVEAPLTPSTEARLLAALRWAEGLIASGGQPGWALGRAATAHGVDERVLLRLWADKRAACDAARARIEQLEAADAETD